MDKGTKKVKNYTEYITKLKGQFCSAETVPDNSDIRLFIDENNLYHDWDIDIKDVIADIRNEILKPKAYRGCRKNERITSYKSYIEQLRENFGIPKSMPGNSCISQFVIDYRLDKIWGITAEDVSKDLQRFIDGEYDEMYKDASYVKPQIIRTVPRPVPITQTSVKSVSLTPNPQTSTSLKKNVKGKTKKRETIYVDGDNHLYEAIEGIDTLGENVCVRAVFSQPGAQAKFDAKYGKCSNVSSELVEPGDQAVDNKIKSEAGQLLKESNQNVIIVSHDNGFKKFADKKNKNTVANRVVVRETIKKTKR